MRTTLTLFALALVALVQAQTVIYVDAAANPANDGSSWATATPDLWQALQTADANASSGSRYEVWVKAGTYTTVTGSTRAADRSLSFEIGAFVDLLGGFAGTETNKLDADPTSNPTILSGDINASGTATDNTYNVVVCDDCGTMAGLSGFTVTGGYADDTVDFVERGRAGAGVYLNGGVGRIANLNISNTIITDNYADGVGGGLMVNGNSANGQAAPILNNVTISNNSAGINGGGVYVDGRFGGVANPQFTMVVVSGNATVNIDADGAGGGLYYAAGDNGTANSTFNQCLIRDNSTSITLDAGQNGANGGGVYVNTGNGSSNLSFDNCIIAANTSYSGGAVYLLKTTSASFANTTVFENQAIGSGGSGGGIYLNESSATIVNHISWDNDSPSNPNQGDDIRFVNGTATISYSLVEASDQAALFSRASTSNADMLSVGAGMVYNEDPMLSSDPAPAIASEASPAINAGENGSAPGSEDYAGSARIQQGMVDLGALESSFAPLPVDLISFAAQPTDAAVTLEWRTAAEVDLSGYRLERRSDDGSFASIVFVPAMDLGTYRYRDLAVAPGETYYYRLVSVDFDGTTYTSDLVTAHVADSALANLATQIYPNPTRGQLTVRISPAFQSRTVYATVIDAQGKKLRFWPLTSDGEHVLDLSDLPVGAYVVRLQAGNQAQSQSFLIER